MSLLGVRHWRPPLVQPFSFSAVCVNWACWAENALTGAVLARYHFITTTCAIIGGVFTVAGIVDGLVHTGARFAKKVELGKHT